MDADIFTLPSIKTTILSPNHPFYCNITHHQHSNRTKAIYTAFTKFYSPTRSGDSF
jgi:hypothetical protein